MPASFLAVPSTGPVCARVEMLSAVVTGSVVFAVGAGLRKTRTDRIESPAVTAIVVTPCRAAAVLEGALPISVALSVELLATKRLVVVTAAVELPIFAVLCPRGVFCAAEPGSPALPVLPDVLAVPVDTEGI